MADKQSSAPNAPNEGQVVNTMPEEHEPRENVCPVVVIGASAGGLQAFTALLEQLPADTGMAYLLVQHLDPEHESLLAEILSRATRMPMRQAEDGMPIEPDRVYVIPPKSDLTLSRGVLHLQQRKSPPEPHMPIDLLMRSVAEDRGGHAIGVILSGTGSDGALGMEAIKGAGGITFAQNPDSATFDGMPRSAIVLDCVDFVLPPQEIAQELAAVGQVLRTSDFDAPAESATDLDESLSEMFRLLRNDCGIDFTHYKRGTLVRRIDRRKILRKLSRLDEYVGYLQDNPAEIRALCQDILIRVTAFFRDAEVFEALAKEVFPSLIANHEPDAPIRIWVPGCSTGEEVYSIAISLIECLGNRADKYRVQVFGTDINPAALERARAGLYVENVEVDVSAERLARFFTKVDAHYRVKKSIRDLCIFAEHDVTTDPPFSRVDLVSCRNVLIYLDRVLQRRVMPVLHYALNPSGFLMLGTSETVGTYANLFQPVDGKHRIYSKILTSERLDLSTEAGARPARRAVFAARDGTEAAAASDAQADVDRFILSKYGPAGIVIDEKMNVLQFRGQAGRYLQHQSGAASLSLQKMACPELLVELGAAIHESRSNNVTARRDGLQLVVNDQTLLINLEVVPLTITSLAGWAAWIRFEELPAAGPERRRGGWLSSLFPREKPVGRRWQAASSADGPGEHERQISDLQKQLSSTQDYLQSLVEEQEAGSEALRGLNEELQSSNEEFQSSNEELETAKEEMQSSNEELLTVNDELRSRYAELDKLNEAMKQARDYAESVVEAFKDPLLILRSDLRVVGANGAFYRTFRLQPTDTVNRFVHEVGGGPWNLPKLQHRLHELDDESPPIEDYEVEGEFPGIGRRTMLLNARAVKNGGAQAGRILLAIEDITERRRLESEQLDANRRKDEFLATLAHELRNPLAPIRFGLQILQINDSRSEDKERALVVMERQVRKMARLVDDLLEVSRITQGKIDLRKEVVDLVSVVRQAVEPLQPEFEAKNQELLLSFPSEPVRVCADLLRLEQVATNLLDNASKYTPAGGRVWLSVEREGNEALVRVRDTGVGIAPDMLPQVFDLFTQAGGNSVAGRQVGLGIGLTLARSLVQMHGGSIEAHSEGLGQGSEFLARLPIVSDAPVDVGEGKSKSRPPPALSGLSVLVVDDNEDAADSLAMLLRVLGCTVRSVYDGAAAIEVAQADKPDAVILDIGLPEMDGYEVARRLRQLPGLEKTRLIALTGYGTEADRSRTTEAGIAEHLVKPVEPEDLIASLSGLPSP